MIKVPSTTLRAGAERMTAAQYSALAKAAVPRKYRNKPVVLDGVRIDSSREARRWLELQIMEKAGSIRDLRRQPVFALAPSVRFEGEKRAKPALRYTADFSYTEGNARIIEDIKSPSTAKTAAFRIKKHLLKAIHGLEIRIVA